MAVKDKAYTINDFERLMTLPENRDRLLELFHGEITEKVPTPDHGTVAVDVIFYLRSYLFEHGDHGLVVVEGRHQIGDENSLLPDVAYFRNMDVSPGGKSFPTMPDLAVEIKSPNDTYAKLQEKADYYLANGSQMAWLFFPEKLEIEARLKNGEVRTLGINDTLDGGGVLPGFSVPVERIFGKIRR